MTSGKEVTVGWRGQRVRAWLPGRLSDRDLDQSEQEVRATERAASAARSYSDSVPSSLEPIGRLLLRAEGMASSRVEGIEAPVRDILLAQAGQGAGAAVEIARNLDVVEDALTHAGANSPFTIELLHGWHTQLMSQSALPAHLIGGWRDEIGWIGGSSPRNAVFVPSPPNHIAALMDDLVEYVNASPWDPVTTTAMVHAQFETIHPYGDGNGRVGRVLILWMLARHLNLATPPPVSVRIARDTDSYLSALGAFRLGRHEQLVGWFCQVLTEAAGLSLDWVTEIEELNERWTDKTSRLRSDSAARRVIPLLPGRPLLNAESVADELGITMAAARNGLIALSEMNIVEDLGSIAAGPGRPRRWWAATDLLDIVGSR